MSTGGIGQGPGQPSGHQEWRRMRSRGCALRLWACSQSRGGGTAPELGEAGPLVRRVKLSPRTQISPIKIGHLLMQYFLNKMNPKVHDEQNIKKFK